MTRRAFESAAATRSRRRGLAVVRMGSPFVEAADPADAIVEIAWLRKADLVVVGVHARADGGCETHQNAARVVRRSGSSVLLVPLPPRRWVERSSAG